MHDSLVELRVLFFIADKRFSYKYVLQIYGFVYVILF